MLNSQQKHVLSKARKTYGDYNQILVSIEELNELACVCAKYPRYNDSSEAREKLHDKILDEVADVYIVLDHIVNILGLREPEVSQRIEKKVDRLERWLKDSNDFQHTTEDRSIPEDYTEECSNGNDLK